MIRWVYRKDMWSNAAMLLDYHSVIYHYTQVIRLCDRLFVSYGQYRVLYDFMRWKDYLFYHSNLNGLVKIPFSTRFSSKNNSLSTELNPG